MYMTKSSIVDKRGKPLSYNQPIKNKAQGLYGNIYSYPNYGKFRPRYYTLGDSSQGVDTLSRELLVRWSREMFAQLPFIPAAIKVLADFSIGSAYLPIYKGTNKDWWKKAEEWLLDEFYTNCSVRGSIYDFQTSLKLESQLIDVDGDYLVLYGSDESRLPKFQIIQNNRIRSNNTDNVMVQEGKFAGCILSDGVYYTLNGKPVGYHVFNGGNLVNSNATNSSDLLVSARDGYLIFDPKYIDKARGIPSIGSAILQALSVQELDSYITEKIKIQSTIALIEKTPSGEAPLELQNQLEALNQQGSEYGGFNPSPNTHAVDIVQGAQIRYVHAEGGDIKTLSENSPGSETADYMARLETQVLSTLGVPHQLIYSTDKTSGRITSGIAEIFRSAIEQRQRIMDKRASLCVSWALARAMEQGIIPMNNEENLRKVVGFTHPPLFTFDKKYESQIAISEYQAGISTLNAATTRIYNKSVEQTLEEQKSEQIMFYTKAQEVSNQTGVPLNTVIAGWRYDQTVAVEAPVEAAADTTTEE